MAEVVSDPTWAPKPGTILYPWHEWMDGQVRILTRGTDYKIETRIMANAARWWGKRHATRVRTLILSEDQFQLQAVRDAET